MQLTKFTYDNPAKNPRYFVDGARVNRQTYEEISDRADSASWPGWVADSFITVKTKTGYKHTHQVRKS